MKVSVTVANAGGLLIQSIRRNGDHQRELIVCGVFGIEIIGLTVILMVIIHGNFFRDSWNFNTLTTVRDRII